MYNGSLGTITNSEDWQFSFDVVDENGDDVDISAANITVAVRKRGDTTPSFTRTVGDGITVATPRFTCLTPDSTMNDLCPGVYDVGCTVEISSFTSQLFIMTLTVVDGIVSV